MRDIYFAAKFSSGVRLRAERDRIHAKELGKVISSWIDQTDKTEDGDATAAASEAFTESIRDMAEVRSADLVIVDMEGEPRRGGRETELGMALGLGKSVWWVGPKWRPGMNIFLQAIPYFATWDDVIEELERDVEGMRDR